MSLDDATAARVSLELVRARFTQDEHALRGALLSLQGDWDAEITHQTMAGLVAAQTAQIAFLADKLARVLDIDLGAVLTLLGEATEHHA